jgi:hypothetical protein
MMIYILILAQLTGATTNLVTTEASRITERAYARRGSPTSAVDLIRLSTLGDWLPAGRVVKTLKACSADAKRHPLSRAVADWLLYERAQTYLDTGEAADARKRLGLLNRFVFRPGSAPHSVAAFDKTKWQRYPAKESTGIIRLDSVISTRSYQMGTIMTDIYSDVSGPAILRIGYDDRATVWWNGDQVYRASEVHDAWLDQHAILIQRRAGVNRLMVQVQRTQGRWAFLGRLTTPMGEPLKYTHEYPSQAAVPEPAEGTLVDGIVTLWDVFSQTLKVDPPQVEALIDLAWYARYAHLPNRDQTLVQVALAGAFEIQSTPSVLHAWLAILPSERQAAKRTLQKALEDTPEDAYTLMRLRLHDAWSHFYARRVGLAWDAARTLRAKYPAEKSLERLWAVLHEDAGWNQTAVQIAKRLTADGDKAIGGLRLLASTLQAAGRLYEEQTHLQTMIKEGQATADERLRLAHIHARRGEYPETLAIIDQMTAAQVWSWSHGFLAIDVLYDSGQIDAARARLEALNVRRPHRPEIVSRLAKIYLDEGRVNEARTLIASLPPAIIDEEVDGLRRRLNTLSKRPQLGPPLPKIKAKPCNGEPAIVLYHHARTDVAADGRASRWIRRVLQLCDEIGVDRYQEMDIHHAPGSQSLTIPVARRIRGRDWLTADRSERSLSDPENRLYFDLRAETLRFPDTQPGDIIEVLWHLRDVMPHPATPGEYGEIAYLQEELPRVRSIVEFGGTGANRINVGVVDQGLDIIRSAGRIEAHNVPAVRLKADGPGSTDLLAYVHLSTQSKWTAVDTAYQTLLGLRGQVSQQLAAIAAIQVKGAVDDRERIERLYNLVADRIRYVGLETGVHSFQPAYPEETWTRGYGDCKDKAILLVALLRSLNIKAQFALIRTRTAGKVTTTPASLSVFDHAMVYLPGMDQFIDPTVENNSVWALPTEDQGATALVIGEGALREVPHKPLDEQTEIWSLDLHWKSDGLSGEAYLSAAGQPGTRIRRAIEPTTNRLRKSNALLRIVLPGYGFKEIKTTGLRPAVDPVRLEGPIRKANMGGKQAHSFHLVPIGLNNWNVVQTWAPAAERSVPVNIPHRYTRVVRYALDVPPQHGISAGQNIEIPSPFGHFHIRVDTQGAKVNVEVKIQRTATQISAQKYPQYRRWLAEIDAALTRNIEVSIHGL